MTNVRWDAFTVLGLDPSSTCIGYGVLSFGRQLVEAGVIAPVRRCDPSWERVMAMCEDLVTVMDRLTPSVICIEWTKGKVGKRHSGLGAGLAVYGCGVGAAAVTAMRWSQARDAVRVVPILENDWTRGVPKDKRQLAIAATYPAYAKHLAADTGADIADGIGIADWWLREREARHGLFERA